MQFLHEHPLNFFVDDPFSAPFPSSLIPLQFFPRFGFDRSTAALHHGSTKLGESSEY